ncbi:hypothetical protein MSG28_005966 [Choristoneura fumiferana]|uniref:Uncharacterized protein n=1 Tax=Choristoneura fumiferana TaxID=7141 RepID=A0ACC0L0U8_CHOFU|nr:hypothetical protein MSG28_005966 [Choristoneura fumiferana]
MEQIRRIMRPTDVPDQGLLCDLLWSDPDKDTTGWGENDRGVSFTFGTEVVGKFLSKHEFDLICRAHQVVEDGYEFFAKRQLVTLFSAPNYCGEFDNAGALMSVDETLMCSFQILKPADKRKLYSGLNMGRPNTPPRAQPKNKKNKDSNYSVKSKIMQPLHLAERDRAVKPGCTACQSAMASLKLAHFDSAFFGVNPKQADLMDPQQRMLLELTHEAIVDAGFNPEELRGSRTGVYLGVSCSETGEIWDANVDSIQGYVLTGCQRAMFANRVSYTFDFKGPSYVVDTACSSSTYALVHAAADIRAGKCDAAIVAGASLDLLPATSLSFHRLNMLSPEGRCAAFDAAGCGYVRSEAIVTVLLQRRRDCRRLYCTVRGAGTNSDGYKAQGITYPKGAIQRQLAQETFKEAHLRPQDVAYFEAHGTGTRAGDPEEVNAIAGLFCEGRTTPLLLGSVKSNMGHSEPASGLCSIAKVVVAMERGVIPGNLHYKTPAPEIPALSDGRIKVVDRNTPWQGGLVAVNSFGFGGANAHVILESQGGERPPPASYPAPRLVLASGRTEAAVVRLLKLAAAHPRDAELHALLDAVHARAIPRHTYRGYAVLNPKRNTPPVLEATEFFRSRSIYRNNLSKTLNTFNYPKLTIDEKIFCCHGGLSPDLQAMEQIRRIMRPTDVPDQGLLCDLLWSDPDKDTTGWGENDRGVSFTFGTEVVGKFLSKHEFDLICRAHQVVEDGYEFFAKRQLVTLFSAPNYCGEFDNAGALMSVDETLMCSFQILKPADKRKLYSGLNMGRPNTPPRAQPKNKKKQKAAGAYGHGPLVCQQYVQQESARPHAHRRPRALCVVEPHDEELFLLRERGDFLPRTLQHLQVSLLTIGQGVLRGSWGVIKRNWWRLRRSPRVADAPTTREFSATTEYILTLIVRADMSLANKKMASHCSHASVMAFDNLLSADPQAARFWLYTGQKKMILAADSVDVINRMDDLARRLGLKTTFVCDDRTDPVLTKIQ